MSRSYTQQKTLFTVTETNVIVYVSIHLSVCCTALCPSFPLFVSPPPPPFFFFTRQPLSPCTLSSHSFPLLAPLPSLSPYFLPLLFISPTLSLSLSPSFLPLPISPPPTPSGLKSMNFVIFIWERVYIHEKTFEMCICVWQSSFVLRWPCKVDGTSEIELLAN